MSTIPQRIVYDLPESVGATGSVALQDSGPFYCYGPGEALHRIDARDFVARVWSGLVSPICDYANWRERGSGSLAVVGPSRDGKGELARIHASVTRELIVENHDWKGAKAFPIAAFDYWDPRALDINAFNRLICPYPFGYSREEVPEGDFEMKPGVPYDRWVEYSKKREIPEELQSEIDKPGGVMALRLAWLREAQKRLGEVHPNVRSVYGAAIEELVQANETYVRYCNWHLTNKEREIKERQGRLTYDHYDTKLLWYIGRKPIDAQAQQGQQQPIIVQVEQPTGQQAAASSGVPLEFLTESIAKATEAAFQKGLEAGQQRQPSRSSSSSRNRKKDQRQQPLQSSEPSE